MMLGRAHQTAANGTTIAWTERGSGPPLVLLHGLADSHHTWRRVVGRLAERYRLLMPDLPGHGLSARPDAPYTLAWYADTLAAWMSAVGLEHAHLCGHSFGGGVSQWMMLNHPHRIERMALVAAGGLGREVAAALRMTTLPCIGPLVSSRLFGPGMGLAMRLAGHLFASPGREEIERRVRLNCAPRSGLAFRRTVASCIGIGGQQVQTWHHVRRVAALPPIALFWGKRDAVIPIAHAHHAHSRLEHAVLRSYDCGHFPQLEVAAPFADDLHRFLQDRTLPAARLRPSAGAPAGVPEVHHIDPGDEARLDASRDAA